MIDELLDALPISGVPGVPGVQPSNGGDSDGTPSGTPGVPEVPALADLLASAVEPGAGEAQQEAVPVPEEERPCFRVYDGWTVTDTGRKLKPGVWYHAMTAPKKNGDAGAGGYLGVRAAVHRGANLRRHRQQLRAAAALQEHGGPLARLGHADGTVAGDGADLRGELLAMGLSIDPNGVSTWRATCKSGSRKSGFAARCKWAGAVPCSCCRMT
jgi:putative DNA primase/helicase